MTSIETIAAEGGHEILRHFARKLKFSDEQIETFESVLDTVKEILETKARPKIHEWEEQGSRIDENQNVLLPDTMQAVLDEIVKDNQIYSLFIPEDMGGFGYTQVFQAALSELFCQYDISLHISTFISLSVIEALTVYYKENFDPVLQSFIEGDSTGYVAFTEPQAGSNLENVKSTAELDGDEYVLNGTKIYISNGGHANAGLFLGKNIVDGEEKGTNVVLVNTRDGVNCERLEDKSGIHVNPTAQLHFEDVRVPKENIISKPGQGYRKVLERLMGMRLGVSMQGTGAAIRAHELAKQYAQDRVQFGKPIIEFDGVARKLKSIEKTIPRMRAYGYQAGYALDRYYKGWIPSEVPGATGDASEKMAAESMPSPARVGVAHYYVSSAKLYNSEVAQNILYDASQIFGGSGFVREYEINKILRDVRILSVYEGTSEIHEFLIGRASEALNLLPNFKPLSAQFDGSTVYEDFLMARFPGLQGKI